MIPPEPGRVVGIAIASILGLIFGSFANVCIHRLPQRRSVVWPGSACPSCGSRIAWYDNIPVISWLVLAGRCRTCRAPIPPTYPLVEIASALLLVGLYIQHGLTLRWAALSYLVISILVLVPIDSRYGILPDRVTLPGIAAGILLSPLSQDPGLKGSLLGAAVGGVVPLVIRALYMVYVKVRSSPAGEPSDGETVEAPYLPPVPAKLEAEEDTAQERREGMGLGDVKMLAMVGAFLGVPKVLLTMLMGSVLGTLYVVPLVLVGRHGMKTPVPFGPFLGVAAIVSVFWGSRIIDWYLGLPFGG